MTGTAKAAARATTRTPSEEVRTALVTAAEAVLVREGPGAVTVRAVAAEAGVAPMGVYNRFGNKDGLVDALLVRGFEGLRRAVMPGDEVDSVQRLHACGLRYRTFALENREIYAAMFGGTIPHGEYSAELKQAATAAFGVLVGNVATGMASGRLAAGDSFDVAQQIWNAIHGAVALEIQGSVQTPDPETTYRSMLGLIMRGLTDPASG